MKQLICLILISVINLPSYSQEKKVSNDTIKNNENNFKIVKRKIGTTTHKIRKGSFDIDNLYYKDTGKKVRPSEFSEIIKNNPRIFTSKLYNERGEVIKSYIDPNNMSPINYTPSLNEIPEKGKLYPEFEFKTIRNKTIRLKDLIGKIVIIRCELFANNPKFRIEEIKNIETKIKNLNLASKIELITVFNSSKSDILSVINTKNSISKFVSNGFGFYARNHVKRFPSTIIIGKDGKLIKVYTNSEEINIKKLAKE